MENTRLENKRINFWRKNKYTKWNNGVKRAKITNSVSTPMHNRVKMLIRHSLSVLLFLIKTNNNTKINWKKVCQRSHTSTGSEWNIFEGANPLYTGGVFHCHMLDEYICQLRGVGSILLLLVYIWQKILLANNVDLDKWPHYVGSDLGPHCLSVTLLRDSR